MIRIIHSESPQLIYDNRTNRAWGTAELFFIILAHWLPTTAAVIFSAFPYST